MTILLVEADLVLLDLMIPKISGMDVMQYIRKISVVPKTLRCR